MISRLVEYDGRIVDDVGMDPCLDRSGFASPSVRVIYPGPLPRRVITIITVLDVVDRSFHKLFSEQHLTAISTIHVGLAIKSFWCSARKICCCNRS